MGKKLKVCYVLSYRAPNYIRTITLLAALARMDGLSILKAVNTSKGIFRYLETLGKLLAIRWRENPDVYILGLRGHDIFWAVRLIAMGRPLIFDHMMSPYDSMVNERRLCRNGGLVERFAYRFENSLLHHADLILTDTPLHKDYFSRLFHLPPAKIAAIPVSTDEELFRRGPVNAGSNEEPNIFEVFFYGSFLPLHGIDIILTAAEILADRPVRFTLVGGGPEMGKKLGEAGNLHRRGQLRHESWINYEDLPRWIAAADLCLGGPFGNTGQARRVITGKTFQFLAMAKPTVIGMIDLESGFIDKENCLLVPQGDGPALADAISWALDHRQDLPAIGRRGQELYDRRFSNEHVREALADILSTVSPYRRGVL